MSKTTKSAGILLGVIVLALLYPTLAHYSRVEPEVETLINWTKNGIVTVFNSSTTLTVNSTSVYSAVSKNVSVSEFSILTIAWVDTTNLQEAAYHVRILQGDKVIDNLVKASDSKDWTSYNKTVKILHFRTIELPAGEYTILYSLYGSNGSVTICEVSVSTSTSIWVVRRIEALAPFLVVLAIGAGVAASISSISSLKKDVERLKILLSLKG